MPCIFVKSRVKPRTLLNVADQGVASANRFAAGVIIARSTDKSEFGLYAVAIAIFLLLLSAQWALIAFPYTIQNAQANNENKAAVHGCGLVMEGIFLIGILSLLLLPIYVFSIYDIIKVGNRQFFLVFALSTCSMLGFEYIRYKCFANNWTITVFISDICVAAFQLLSLIILAYLEKLTATIAYAVSGFACLIISVIWLIKHWYVLRYQLRSLPGDLGTYFRTGRWLLASSVMITVSISVYPWLIACIHGQSVAAQWAVCWGTVAMANPIAIGIQNWLRPHIAQAYADECVEKVRRAVVDGSRSAVLLIAPFTLILLVNGGEFVEIIYGQKYAGLAFLVRILAISEFSSAVLVAFGTGLVVIGLPRLDFISNVVRTGVFILLGVPLVLIYGPLGAGIGHLVCTITSEGLKCHLFYRESIKLINLKE